MEKDKSKNPAHNPPEEDQAIKSAKGTGKDLDQVKGNKGKQQAPPQKHDGKRQSDQG